MLTKKALVVNILNMALFDIFRKSKQKEDRLKRPPKGALKKPLKSGEKNISAEVSPSKKITASKPVSTKNVVGKEKSSDLASIVFLAPHITEKTAVMAEGNNVYAFRVNTRANKITTEKAFRELYGFNPLKVRILNMPSKKRIVRGRVGMKSGFKKALIYLRKGEKIELA